MYLADPTFGLDRYALTILTLLSKKEPSFAAFNPRAQAYEIAIRTGLYLAGEKCWVSLTMFPTFQAGGVCKVLVFGRAPISDEIHVESWQPTELVTESPRYEDERHSTTRAFEPDILHVAGYIENELAQAYGAMRMARATTRRLQTPSERDPWR